MTTATHLVLVAIMLQCLHSTYAGTKNYCGPPDSPLYGGFYPQNKFYPVGSGVRFYCNKGFNLQGYKSAVCLFDLKNKRAYWSRPSPKCISIVRCPYLNDPKYGDVDVSGNTPGSKATYTCDRGFKLDGNSVRYCQKNGYWTGSDPVCRPTGCGKLPFLRYGYIKYRSTSVGSKAYHFCNKGYYLKGDHIRVCQYNGYWSGNHPECVYRGGYGR